MIRTFYSNSFEILQEVLIQKVGFDIEDMRTRGTSIFERIPVIIPSPMTEDRLKRTFADRLGVVPGIEFTNTASWLYRYLSSSISNKSISGPLDWLLFKLLTEKKAAAHSASDKEKRLLDYLSKLDDVGVLEFARHVNNVFVTYGSYRFDWLKSWSEETKGALQHSFKLPPNPIEQAALEANPDFIWQKKIWQELIDAVGFTANKRAGHPSNPILGWIENTLDGLAKLDVSHGESSVHLFMPFSLPPIMLPLIRKFALEDSKKDLNLYLLNPCSEYWFESLPRTYFDWTEETQQAQSQKSEAALRYLWSNAASTRASIDRLDGFLHDSEESTVIEQELTEEQMKQRQQTPVAHPAHRKFMQQAAPVREAMESEADSAYLEYPNDTFLHRFQNSILKLDTSLLPDAPDSQDTSLRVLQAPSFMREVEACVDILQNWFADPGRSLKPSDVLVVVPDINKAAPIIEGVMTSLPKRPDLNLEIPWRIVGQSEADLNQTAIAFTAIGKLLTSDFTIDRFLECLENEPLQQNFGLSLNDLSVLRVWLQSAGYRFGFDQTQLASLGLPDEDISLENAIERLTVGFFLDADNPLPFMNTIPVRGNEDSGFDITSDESGRLFKPLCAYYRAISDIRGELFKTDFALPPQAWQEQLERMIARLFADSDPAERFSLKGIVESVCKSLTEVFEEHPEPIHLDILLSEIQSSLKNASKHASFAGTLTFAQIEACRGIPFKVIFCLGFDEGSGFPGTPKFEEFDLMKTVRRRADRDARKDNNAVFLDTLLAARENLIISYTVGTKPQSDNNPSIVIENFKNYFTSHAREVGLAKKEGAKDADNLWKSIVSRVPLNRFSERNFYKGENNLFWRSPRFDILWSVENAKALPTSSKLFADAGVPVSSLPAVLRDPHHKTLSADILISFVSDPLKWVNKHLKLDAEAFGADDADDPALVPDFNNPLFKAMFFRETLALIREGFSADSIRRINDLNPKYGMPCVRSIAKVGAEDAVLLAWKLREAYQAGSKGPLTDKLSFPRRTLSQTNYEITDTVTDFYEGESLGFLPDFEESGGTQEIVRQKFVIAVSDTQTLRENLRQLIWIAAGRPYELVVLTPQWREGADGKPTASFHQEIYLPEMVGVAANELLELLLNLFEFQCVHTLGVSDKYTEKHGKTNEEEARAELPTIWLGAPLSIYEKVKNLSSNSKKELKNYFVRSEFFYERSDTNQEAYEALKSLLKNIMEEVTALESQNQGGLK